MSHPTPDPGPPRIDRLLDLGGLPLPSQGELDQGQSDGRLTPGEWVAVVGRHLSQPSRIAMDGTELEGAGYLAGG